ncbi:Dabb family protein [Streptomyces sp. NPDC048629]|uniref:Dabb family protein n=1 Tax=Streptomyces sp. NPDC048629 TaxID=3154824 RepID=UPI003427E7A0
MSSAPAAVSRAVSVAVRSARYLASSTAGVRPDWSCRARSANRAAARLPGVRGCSAGRDLPGSFGGTPPETVARFEADVMGMPEHITAIRAWALSRVTTDVGRPAPARWTHVWEQEFADVDGLTGDYLLHPYHWTYVDRWFDPELPTSIVSPALAHVYRWTDTPVLVP